LFNGIAYTAANNTAKDTILNTSGCDSIITLNLTITPYLLGTRVATICQGQSYVFNGVSYTTGNNTAKDTIINPIGCDSIVMLNLTVNPYLYGVRSITICHGQQYVFNGVSYSANNNTAKDTILTSGGCDSIITLDLIVLPQPGVVTSDTSVCGSFTFNGEVYTTSGIITDTLKNLLGCDSLYRIVHLTIYPAYSFEEYIDTVTCNTFIYKDYVIYHDTTFVEELKTSLGCDSLKVIWRIRVENFELNLSSNTLNPWIGELITLNTAANAEYEVLSWMPSILFPVQDLKTQSLIIQELTGVTVTAASVNGCLDTAMLLLDPFILDHIVSKCLYAKWRWKK
jgi:hypothetical protein